MFAVLGILLVIAGAILVFAVERSAEGIDLAALGWILIVAGVASLLAAAFEAARWYSMGSNRIHVERHMSADGRHYVEDVRAD